MPSLVNLRSFMRIRCNRMEIWDPKIANFYKTCMPGGKRLPPGRHLHFVLKNGVFLVPYFHEFATDSYETLQIYCKDLLIRFTDLLISRCMQAFFYLYENKKNC